MGKWSPVVDWPEDVVSPVKVDGAGLTRAGSRSRAWVRTSHGLFVPATTDRGRVEQRILEAAARLPADGAVTGWAALRLAGGRYFDALAPDGVARLPVPLAVRLQTRLRPQSGVYVVRAGLTKDEVHELHGVRCTVPTRAVFDEVRRVGDLREAVVGIDMALVANFLTLGDLDGFIADNGGRPGIELMRAARPHVSTRSASPQETRMRLVWTLDAGLPTPLCNWPIADLEGRYLGRPDVLAAGLGVYGEYDGKDHRDRERHRQDVGREDSFLGVGLEGFKVVGPDLHVTRLVVQRMLATVDRAAASNRPRRWMLRHNPRPLWP